MKKLSNIYKVLLAICVTSLISCEKFIEVDPPKGQTTKSILFSNETTAISAMSNIYFLCAGNNFASGGANSITRVAGMLADEFDTYSTAQDLKDIYQNTILPQNVIVNNIWQEAYHVIYQSNAIIEGLKQSTSLTESLKQQLTGEALFMRAFSNFYLANIYGDVPYINSTDYRANTTAKRIAYRTVLNYVIDDLKQAKGLLHEDYPIDKTERIRPNKWAASALLARVYLYQQDWVNAELQANEVLAKDGIYRLTPLADVFLKNSKEAIWQIKPVSNNTLNTHEGVSFILIGRPIAVYLKEGFSALFEVGDQRKAAWVGNFTNADGSWDFPYKYKIRTGGVPFNEYSMVLRLAEQFLIRAEARAKQNNLSGAIDDLDEIRHRAGLTKISVLNPNISKDDFLLVLEKERRMELFSEWGHRWFDLKRTGRIDAVLKEVKPAWVSTAALFPIPANECLINVNMVQNPGYN
ncbi:RagB/SusD family nutrient uptake outer membrane protein [Pedobacter nyackensis]|uniref:RagB/SusD family nutrient uptake outer membrane protein n=1 Tax=Pedobacter nyackensis TaxID=475255 RepID=UPI00292F365F|nr:RagB/SusD family nutrient uptake outer membrane protein [Pedobacter nyackensis]